TDIHIDPEQGADSLVLDFTNGAPLTAQGLTYDGGAGVDSLTIRKGKFSNVIYTRNGAGGSFLFNGVPVTFTDVETVIPQFTTVNLTLRYQPLMHGPGAH